MTGAHEVPVTRGRRVGAWVRAHPGLVFLLVIPLVVLVGSQAFGRVYLNGDNYLQNLPLRALVGRDLSHGHLPLWNPYLSSGTPLLAGFNAGAAYPATWLMAVLPTLSAWTLNLVFVYEVAAVGMYLFLRRLPVSSTAATFGAGTFTFAGFMTAQSVHIDLIEGASWLPWMALAVHALTEPLDPDRSKSGSPSHPRLAWTTVLTVAVGLSFLTGGVESIIDSVVLVGIYGIGRLVTMGYFGRDRLRSLLTTVVWMALGIAGGAALGAAQWLPGALFASNSQRSTASYSFFTSGSLPERLVTLVVSPFVLGTNQHHPGWYAGPYNFEEVSSYMGVLALIAVCSLFLRKWRTRPEARHWWIWYVVIVIGLLSALGGQTPFGRLLFVIPGINNQRLLSRNLLLVDFALAVLLAWWVHLLLDRRADPAPEARSLKGRWRPRRWSEVVVTCIPLALATFVCLFLWISGPQLYRLLEIQYAVSADTRRSVALLVTGGVVIAAAATWIVLSEARFTTRQLRWSLAGVLLVDLLVFNWFIIQSPITEASAKPAGVTAAAFRSLVGDARFIIYDPDQFQTPALYALGQTDLNIYDRVPSAQGYTALTDASYYSATGAHYQEDLDPTTLAGTTWDDLNVSTLLSLPGYFVTPVSPPAAAGGDPIAFPPHPASYNSSPVPAADSFHLDRNQGRQWYFGGMLTVHSFSVPLTSGAPPNLRIGLVTSTGSTQWLARQDVAVVGTGQHRSLEVKTATPTAAGGVVIEGQGPKPVTIGIPTVATTEAGTVALDGRLQYGVTPPHWVFTGMFGPFSVFHNAGARGWAQVRTTGGASLPGSSVSAGPPADDGSQTITVHAPSDGLLLRSEAWSTGWRATIRRTSASTSSARSTPVQHVGTIQGVSLPGAGDYVVTFTYRPGSALLGVLVSGVVALGVVAVFVMIGWDWIRRRRIGHKPSTATVDAS